ncbi:hypothetical protein [Roseateles terrae]|uniref:Uncharacterized protein n=1 Tax=Roseateles terrae TaxID=431060 RepID=A0ABR6GPR8_9BURK|nr:hypothetical protein [Roseateles terrae]MBB3194064.1 hypothetical protein [Roseateles terrae]OWQ87929.1 hypothetical protein CDN98_07180 [Roseateles terrae]
MRHWSVALLGPLIAPLLALSAAHAKGTTLDAAGGEDPAPVVLVTPFVEGSGPDHVARVLARAWSARTGESVTVKNLPEDQGRTAARWVAEAGTDGRLVLLTSARMLDAHPPVLRADRQRRGTAESASAAQWEASPPVSLARFRLLAQVGGLPFMSVFPADLTPSPMQSRAAQLLGGSRPPPDPRILSALARMDDLSADASDRIEAGRASGSGSVHRVTTRTLPPLISHPDRFPRTNWNGLLVSAQMPAARAEAMQHLFSALLSRPDVRWAVAEAGSDLWEAIPPPMPVETMPLRR